MTLVTRRAIPLSAIVGRSPANCRAEGMDLDLAGLAASLDAVGQLHPLLVSTHPQELDKFWIDDGGRRFEAFKLLREMGKLAHDAPVDCDVAAMDEGLARERSLAANVMRRDLHPVDQCEAFFALVDVGVSVEKIAADFAVTTRHVRQRLRLTALSPRVRAAWRDGLFSADVAAAFTIAAGHTDQDKLLDESCPFDVHTIRTRLRGDAMRADCKEARYVGLEDYVAAGGIVDDNLFEDFSLCRDGALLKRLAREKLLAQGSSLIEQWALGSCQLRDDITDYPRWSALPREFTRVEAEQIEAGVDTPTDIAINVKAMERKARSADVITSALVLWLDDDGLRAEVGMVSPVLDKAFERALPKAQKAASKPKSPEPFMPPETPPNPGKPLVAAIREARNAGVVAALLANPDMAAIMAIAALQARHNNSPLRIATLDRNRIKAARTLPCVGFERAFEEVRHAIANPNGTIDRDRADALLAQVVAESVCFRDHVDDDAGSVLRCIAVNVPEDFTTGAVAHFDYDGYFAAVPRGAALAILEELGVANADTRRLGAGAMQHAAKVSAKDERWLPAELRLEVPASATMVKAAEPVRPLAQAMRDAIEAHEGAQEPRSANNVGRFLDVCCVRETGTKIKASVLFEAYAANVRQQGGTNGLNLREFGDEITALGIAKKREKTGIYYSGLSLAAGVPA